MLLATHQEIQDRVAAEIKEVFYSDDIEISYDNIVKLEYLERVIKESLRLCPVVPVCKTLLKNYQLKEIFLFVPYTRTEINSYKSN
ncbi:hypothetical protein PVAND_011040 [Polypedilum vanderplanki]|uniref:Cytochrome P450 n=1 Tax=Polypedilum vanderplanki TaxID=319348 RepID=A0A9J6CIC2_POLVA|nr:hypothetical protein PVAND_011040 [Polypedilum vanderplanki]